MCNVYIQIYVFYMFIYLYLYRLNDPKLIPYICLPEDATPVSPDETSAGNTDLERLLEEEGRSRLYMFSFG